MKNVKYGKSPNHGLFVIPALILLSTSNFLEDSLFLNVYLDTGINRVQEQTI